MKRRIGAALVAVLLTLHTLLGFGAGSASAWAAEAPVQTAQSDPAANEADALQQNAAAQTPAPAEQQPAVSPQAGPAADSPAQNPTPAEGSAGQAPAAVDSAEPASPNPAESAPADQEGTPAEEEGASEPDAPAALEEAEPAEEAAPQPANILTSVSLTDDEGHAVGSEDGGALPPRVDPSQALNLNYKWSLPNDHTYKNGSTFEFDLPSEFRIYTDIRDVPLAVGGEGEQSVGSFSVSTDGHAVVTFNRFVEEYSNIAGTLTIRSELKEEIVKESTEIRIAFPIGEASQVIVLYLQPQKGALIDKQGTVDNAAGRIAWTVDLNTSLERLSGAALSDPIPEGLTLDADSVRVYRLNVSPTGGRTPGDLLAPERYTLSGGSDGSELRLSFAGEPINEAYRVVYSTTIGGGAQTKFTNTATLTAESRDGVSASATVTVKRGELLTKTVAAYDPSTQSIDWTILYNQGTLTIPQRDALLKDRFTSSQRLVEGSLVVQETATGRTLAANTDYTVTNVPTSSGRTGFDLQFLGDVNQAYTIAYRTTATGTVYGSDKITNTVAAGGVSKSAGQTLQRSLLSKTNTGVNYGAKTSSWRTIVNEDSFAMENALLVDTFPNGGLEMIPASLKIVDASGTALNPADYTLTIPEGNRSGFTIRFNKTLTDRVTVTYATRFNQTWKIDRSKADFVNAAKLTWTEKGESRSRDVTSRFTPGPLTTQNGSKSGSYNPQTKELTWTVKANYNRLPMNGAALTDVIQQGQRYVEGSLAVNALTLTSGKDGTQKGAVVNPSDYSVEYPDASNGQRLKISFKEVGDAAYWITFKTTVDGQIVGASASNEASLELGGTVSDTWKASAPIPGGSEYVTKSGVQQGGKIAWSVSINRGQSYVENAKVVDTPTPNQLLDESSFKLYRAVPDASGNLTRGQLIEKDRDYSLVITSGTEERFELTFSKPIDSAYILDYASTIYAADREKVGNQVSFSGTGVTTGQTDTTRAITVRTSSGSGTGSGERGALEVKKVDAADEAKLLPGATFVLQDVNKRRPAVTRTTDADGRIVFAQLLYGSYTLTETKTPEGYLLPAEPALALTIDSGVRLTNGVKTVTVANRALPPVLPGPEQPGTDNPGPGTPGTGEPGSPVNPGTPTVPTTPPDNGGTPTVPAEPTVPVTVPDDGVPSGTPGTPAVPSVPGTPQETPTAPISPEPETSVPDDGTPSGTPTLPAEPEIPAPGDPVPQGVPPVIPSEPEWSVPDGGVPQGTPPVVPGTVVPETAPTLPQTGEESKLPFFLTGAGLLLAGFWLRRKAARNAE